ncbi:MAG: ABC transporter permease subunit, partial [Anaerolineae bacterium]|nr:ABC transporter permease subunit [Anaerolineae bacterium]
VALLIIPFEAVAVPLLLMVNRFGWLDSYHVQIIPFIADAFSIFLFYQFFIGLPKDLDEAALVDGASPFRIYWNLILPLSRPVFAT